ncbi:MAG: hypothetical protein LUD53_01655 [Clostridiales bacterium]|nr:hypothetical protein [Clostridiales bacterium]
MTEFSEECRKLIEKSNTNVYQIAKSSGLGRTTLQKMVQGKRLPSIQFVNEFCAHLVINKSEKERLNWLFRIEKVGRDVFRRRQEIAHLLRYFAPIRKSMEDGGYQRRVSPEFLNHEGEISVRRTVLEVDVIDAIQYMVICACEKPGETHIYMDAFDQVIYAMQQMIREERCHARRIVCHQFIKVERGPDLHGGVGGDLKMLQYIIPFAFSFEGEYNVSFSYVSVGGTDPDFSLWPHYIVTDHHVLLLAEDGKTGLFIENDQVAGGFVSELRKMEGRCRPFFPVSGKTGEVLEYYTAVAAAVQPVVSGGGLAENTVPDEGLRVELYEPDRLFFFAGKDEKETCLCVEEAGLFRVFLDYFENTDEEWHNSTKN